VATIAEALKRAEASIDRIDAQYLLCAILDVGRASLVARSDQPLGENHARQFEQLTTRRANGAPVAYLLGTREFYGRDFKVNEHVLIPRPETEILVEQALARVSGQKWPGDRANARVCDLGTGSGAIAVTLALESPTSQVTACDVSSAALNVARENATRLSAAVEFVESNWYSALSGRTFDLIVSNPPYVAGGDAHLAEGDLRFEPQTALTDGSNDGLASIRTIVGGAPAHLASGGWLLFEHGYDQAASARELLLKAGFYNLICIRDLAGIERVSGGQIG
jgi:release factor glutamine methyltransferase